MMVFSHDSIKTCSYLQSFWYIPIPLKVVLSIYFPVKKFKHLLKQINSPKCSKEWQWLYRLAESVGWIKLKINTFWFFTAVSKNIIISVPKEKPAIINLLMHFLQKRKMKWAVLVNKKACYFSYLSVAFPPIFLEVILACNVDHKHFICGLVYSFSLDQLVGTILKY